MGVGVSIFLIILGAIFKFAVTAHLSGVNLQMIGVILMLAGVAMLIINIAFSMRRRTPSPHEQPGAFEDRPPQP